MEKALFFLIGMLFIYNGAAVADDKADLEKIFGQKGQAQEDVVKFSFPRSDLKVKIGNVRIEAGLALGSWAAFKLMQKESMVMGDMVLTTDEVARVINKFRKSGIEVTALHNHLMGSTPIVWYMHFSGHGDSVKLAESLKSVLAETATPMKPAASKNPKAVPAWAKIEDILGMKGQQKGGLLQFSIPRKEVIVENGMDIPPSMGVANSINFQSVNGKAATTGDFVLIAKEVNPVIEALTNHGIRVTAIHNHMLNELPRLFFLHFWGYDSPENLANGIKAALDEVNIKKEK